MCVCCGRVRACVCVCVCVCASRAASFNGRDAFFLVPAHGRGLERGGGSHLRPSMLCGSTADQEALSCGYRLLGLDDKTIVIFMCS